MTPLHWTTFNEDVETSRLLLRRGAKYRFNKKDQTPVDIAGFCRLKSMVNLFTEELALWYRTQVPQYHVMHRMLDKYK
jgi:ankyrin repeat protein